MESDNEGKQWAAHEILRLKRKCGEMTPLTNGNIHEGCTLGALNHSHMSGDCPECAALTKVDHLSMANTNLLRAINVLGDKLIQLEKLGNKLVDTMPEGLPGSPWKTVVDEWKEAQSG